MDELLAYGISSIILLTGLYSFRKTKPKVKSDKLVFELPWYSKVGLILSFALFLGFSVFSIIDKAAIIPIAFFVIFSLIIGSALPLMRMRFIISGKKIFFRNAFGKWKEFDLNIPKAIDYSSNIGVLEFKFESGKAIFFSGFGGSSYLLHFLLTRYKDKLSPQATDHINHQLNLHYLPII